MKRWTYHTCVLCALAGLMGCSGAHYVYSQAGHCVIAIPENTNKWPTYYRDQADALIRQSSPNGFVIEHEAQEFKTSTAYVDAPTQASPAQPSPTVQLAGAQQPTAKNSATVQLAGAKQQTPAADKNATSTTPPPTADASISPSSQSEYRIQYRIN